ncbi:hypothetical protein HPT25_22625 [Bacillus sp. BRMEA1]|uniref:hypothetical protein n=1 Tax=Neobacillus endophyticus TaxID=2738405 RepID=UPI001567565B|nr:hypothetical protein [Neobacillus endophyticus]NRD80137.1 hypothetical protein [Neobacillus endophyticus]
MELKKENNFVPLKKAKIIACNIINKNCPNTFSEEQIYNLLWKYFKNINELYAVPQNKKEKQIPMNKLNDWIDVFIKENNIKESLNYSYEKNENNKDTIINDNESKKFIKQQINFSNFHNIFLLKVFKNILFSIDINKIESNEADLILSILKNSLIVYFDSGMEQYSKNEKNIY